MKRDQVQWIVEFSVGADNLEQFKEHIKEIVNAVNYNEPGTKSYQWYFNDDETRCIVTEWYIDSKAGLDHINGQAVRTILIPKILKVASIKRIEVYGNINKELQEALRKFGSINYHFFTGFIR